MKVSIVIPNYNGKKYLKACISSLNNQSFKDFELIVVDNASKDDSIEFISENYSNVKLIALKENYGFSRAVDEGIKASNADYVVLLNNDTEVDKYWLENLVRCIEKDATIFSCCSKMIRYNEREKIDDAGDEYTVLGWALKNGDGSQISSFSKSKRVFSSCGGAAIYRRRVFSKIGYFDENFFAYLEDMDISYRANIHGYKNIFCSDALVYHIGSATSGSRHNSFKVKLAARNNIYLIYKNMPILQLIINLPFLLIGHLIKYLYFIKKGLSKDYKEGLVEAFKNLKQVNKVKYKNKNFINYIAIEVKLVVNVFKLFRN